MTSVWGKPPQVNGYVRNGHTPITNAIIVHHPTGSWTVTDEFGFFSTVGFAGDSITVYHYGFNERQTVIPAYAGFTIQLNLNPLEMKPINVTGYRSIQINHIPVKPGRALSSTMASIPSLTLRTYGGIGGLGTASIDGGLTSHTKILWNGIDLTSPQNGETDLSQMPFFLVGQLSISRTPALSFGSGSIDGSILISSPKSSRIDVTSGSFGLRSIAGQIKIPSKNWKTDLGFGSLNSAGDFDYDYQGKNGKIQNNRFNQTFFSLGVNRAISRRWFVSFRSLFTNQDRGIPGLVFSPSPKAHRNDELQLFNIKTIRQIPNHLLSISITTRNSDEHYINPQYAVDSQHDLTASQMEIGWKTSPLKSIELDQKLILKKETISSTDTDDHNRFVQSYVNAIRWAISQNLSNESGIRFDREHVKFSAWTWQAGFEYQMKNGTVSLMSGNGFRYPTFNDMYWNPGGNPSLFPETTNWIRAHWVRQLKKHELSFRVSSKRSKNLIQWTPADNYWQPQNIAKAQRNTFTFTLDGKLFKPIRYTAHFSYNNSKDLNENKPLRYAPEYLGAFGLKTESLPVSGWLQGQYVGKRITLYSWPKDVTIGPHFIFSGGFNWSMYQRMDILFSVENLLNEQYMTVNGYPEPGRSFSLTLQIKPQLK